MKTVMALIDEAAKFKGPSANKQSKYCIVSYSKTSSERKVILKDLSLALAKKVIRSYSKDIMPPTFEFPIIEIQK